MRFALDINTREYVLWADMHIFRRVFGVCWKKPDGRKWRHLIWCYRRSYPSPQQGSFQRRPDDNSTTKE